MSLLKGFFTDPSQKYLKSKTKIIQAINDQEKEIEKLTNDNLKQESLALKAKIQEKGFIENNIIRGFALVREAARRNLNQRHFDVQLLGGLALHEGKVIEMKTGEGKTLAATLPAYLNALLKKGVHIVTVNDYLARRDTVWMGQIYYTLGLSVGCIGANQSYLYDPNYAQVNKEEDKERDILGGFKVFEEFLRPVTRQEAYEADITYGTNTEFGFDYLRDNLAQNLKERVQRGHYYAIIDEVDSILIDEARTPLIISVPDEDAGRIYQEFTRIVPRLKRDEDYKVDEKLRTVSLTEEGLNKIEKIFGFNIFDQKGILAVHHLEEALKAHILFQKDKDYVVKDGEVIIVDEFTGRLLYGRRYAGGLHQAIEAKEGVAVKEESRTVATITTQNYFRMYEKLAGMTGTALTSAEEFYKVYHLDTVAIPTNKKMIRVDLSDKIYKTMEAKFRNIVKEIKSRYEKGQPVLVGTVSIEKNEYLSELLKREGIPHKVLNAKHHEEEGAIIAQAGKFKAVTVATNMAGRGVDIILGGNPPDPKEKEKILSLGGLHVIGTERHEARRIDNQLRGRSGRQGDPGSSQFFVSLEDDLMRIFGGKNIGQLMERLGVKEDEAIEHSLISKAIESAQSKIEGFNLDMRKHILEYDDVLNRQRLSFYNLRNNILIQFEKGELFNYLLPQLTEQFLNIIRFWQSQNELETVTENLKFIFPKSDPAFLIEALKDGNSLSAEIVQKFLLTNYQEEKKKLESNIFDEVIKSLSLSILDNLWMDHLEQMEYLRDSVNLRVYGQKDALVEYKYESYRLYKDLENNFYLRLLNTIFRLDIKPNQGEMKKQEKSFIPQGKIGRNDPCPCGSGKKYKKCHGK